MKAEMKIGAHLIYDHSLILRSAMFCLAMISCVFWISCVLDLLAMTASTCASVVSCQEENSIPPLVCQIITPWSEPLSYISYNVTFHKHISA